MESRRPLDRLDINGYATFPRRKRYSWYLPGDSLQERQTKLERRRTQLLDKYSESEDTGNVSIGEWIAVVKERDHLLKESVRQQNEKAKRRFVCELQHLLSDIPDFSPQTDKELVQSVAVLKQKVQCYCTTHDITNSVKPEKRNESTSSSQSPPKPPLPPNKPILTPRKSTYSAGSFTATSAKDRCGVPEVAKETQTDEKKGKELAPPSLVKVYPLVPPPPPPPPTIPSSGTPPLDIKRPSSSSLPNSNNSSLSLQQEISTHQKDTLRKVIGPKSPGGTPLRSLKTCDHADMLQKALMNKFRTVHIHSTPKRGGLMESGSIEISNTWSEWGASINQQYASDPDLTHFSTDFSSSPLPLSSAHSAADFDSSFSSPSLNS